ncbi:hypothetical protein ACLRGF_07365 [Mycetocola zhadangensis]|jgi:hypothetical protein|uniref:hypothetical protein n=1 Tax=Mycetocola zhadangensis TaxID=1164595 RepID=UPI003A4D4592
MTNSHTPDEHGNSAIPGEEYGADERFTGAAEVSEDQGADYTTTGDPIDDPEHLAEEHELHATTGTPLSGADVTPDDADRTTVGNPITSPAHEAEEEVPHATPGNNPLIPED